MDALRSWSSESFARMRRAEAPPAMSSTTIQTDRPRGKGSAARAADCVRRTLSPQRRGMEGDGGR
jgi:hypothetical protein